MNGISLRAAAYIVIGSTIVVALVAVFFVLIVQPVYRAESTLLPAESNETSLGGQLPGALGGLAALAGVDTGNSQVQTEALATLQSRQFLGSFIDRHEIRKILFPAEWDEEQNAWYNEAPSLNDAYEKFIEDVLAVREDSGTGTIKLQIDWTDRELAAEWANQLVANLNETMRARAAEQALRSIQYLEKEREATSSVTVRQSISSLMEEQVNRIMLANVHQEYAFRVIDPAVVPDADDPQYPKPALMIAASLMVGFLLGLGIVSLLSIIRVERQG